jgi:HEPN superfamily AbiU2-like protein
MRGSPTTRSPTSRQYDERNGQLHRSPEEAFARELEIFRTEAEAAAQFFYTYLAMHEVAKRNKDVFRMFDEHAMFWKTLLGGVQTSALIALGRVFDQQSKHNIDALIRVAQRNPFSSPGLP